LLRELLLLFFFFLLLLLLLLLFRERGEDEDVTTGSTWLPRALALRRLRLRLDLLSAEDETDC
jgi:hypothetical protein